eukprot:superscaffoldBa00002319_g13900
MKLYVFNSPSGGPFLVWALAVQLVLCGSGVFANEDTKNCILPSESESERKVLDRLAPLAHKNFTVQTKNEKNEEYTYVFQLCGDAGGVPGAGVIQLGSKKTDKPTVVGSYNATQAIGGSDWVMLIYRGGDKYDGHCSRESRRAIIMISCDRKTDVGPLEVIAEDRERVQDCFYLFELDTSAVCPPVQSQISTGSIILIMNPGQEPNTCTPTRPELLSAHRPWLAADPQAVSSILTEEEHHDDTEHPHQTSFT